MSSKKEKILESAQKFILKGQLDRAIKDYEQVVALDPNDIRHRQRLAELMVRVNRKHDAISEYEAIGKYYADNSYYLKAIAVYKQIQKLDPDNIQISLNLARLNEKQELTGNALAEYSRIYSHYEKAGRHSDALSILESMLAIEPDNLNTRLKFAETRFASGKKEQALEDFIQVGRILKEQGDQRAFTQVGERITYLFPGSDDLNLLVASSQLKKEEPPSAGAERATDEKVPEEKRSMQGLKETPVATAQEVKPPGIPGSLEVPEDAGERDEPKELELDLSGEIVPAERAVEPGLDTPPPEEPAPAGDVTLELELSDHEMVDLAELDSRIGEEDPFSGDEGGEGELPLELDDEEQGADDACQDPPFVGEDHYVEMVVETETLEAASAEDFVEYGLDGLFSDCGELDQQVDEEDAETRYNLGIAYKEMGMFDKAIAEFRAAAANPRRKLDCVTLQGVCCRDKGDLSGAEEVFRQGLDLPGLSAEEYAPLKYELAILCESEGREWDALLLFREIEKVCPGFRDTAEKIAGFEGEREDVDDIDLVELDGEVDWVE